MTFNLDVLRALGHEFILQADELWLGWHRAVAPGVQVGEITTHGLALSRLKHEFEAVSHRTVPSTLAARCHSHSSPGRASRV